MEASGGRFVSYSTFGNNFSHKLGARYTPLPDVTLRGTWSTAFRAPSISELYLGQSETAPIARDPCGDLSSASQALRDQCAAAGVPAGGSGDLSNQVLSLLAGRRSRARVYGPSRPRPGRARPITRTPNPQRRSPWLE